MKIALNEAMIQFTSRVSKNECDVLVTKHPDPVCDVDKLSAWILFEYEANRINPKAPDLAIKTAMFMALWEIAVVYDIPTEKIHKEMLKVDEYCEYFGHVTEHPPGASNQQAATSCK